MQNRPLHDALRTFAVDSARHLAGALDAGAELPFEVAEEPGAGSPLYRYRPLTEMFVAEHWPALRALPSAAAAMAALGSGAASYLRRLGAHGADAEPALQAMLERLYEDLTSFSFPEDRFERVYAELELALYAGMCRTSVVVGVPGLAIPQDRIGLGEGLSLVRAGEVEAPPPALRPAGWPGAVRGPGPRVLCVLERETASRGGVHVEEARDRFARMLRALRLLGPGGVALAPVAWARVDESPWQAVALEDGGRVGEGEWSMSAAEVAELEELLDLLDTPPATGPVRWALGRFEMGCARERDTEGLSDHLLALRALVDGGDDFGRASLPLRVAALCAEEPDRRAVQRRLEAAFALERFLIRGGVGDPYLEAIGPESPASLVEEVEEHVRGLLRDVLCGYLEPDLAAVADEILLRSAEPIEIRAWDTREETAGAGPPGAYRASGFDFEPVAEPRQEAAGAAPGASAPPAPEEPEPGAPPAAAGGGQPLKGTPNAPHAPAAAEWVATAGLPPGRRVPPGERPAGHGGPAPSPDFDEDPGSYSAPA